MLTEVVGEGEETQGTNAPSTEEVDHEKPNFIEGEKQDEIESKVENEVADEGVIQNEAQGKIKEEEKDSMDTADEDSYKHVKQAYPKPTEAIDEDGRPNEANSSPPPANQGLMEGEEHRSINQADEDSFQGFKNTSPKPTETIDEDGSSQRESDVADEDAIQNESQNGIIEEKQGSLDNSDGSSTENFEQKYDPKLVESEHEEESSDESKSSSHENVEEASTASTLVTGLVPLAAPSSDSEEAVQNKLQDILELIQHWTFSSVQKLFVSIGRAVTEDVVIKYETEGELEEDCVDSAKSCGVHLCDVAVVANMCKRTCGMCPSATNLCQNTYSDTWCSFSAGLGYCSHDEIAQNCKDSCNKCPEDCEDVDEDFCEMYGKFHCWNQGVREMCAKSCFMC